ncbi:tRNA (guanine-N(7)-)-methyltransferase non-catalytic subunit trm82 [Tulasnella sp. 427]|nr:tRNA (guanine-N(7)-)-methyltransferase non-catalytic subunit trm82 [Tulasnella sp. 427]
MLREVLTATRANTVTVLPSATNSGDPEPKFNLCLTFLFEEFSKGILLSSTVVCASGLVTAADVCWSSRRVVTTGDDKMLNVWSLGDELETGLIVSRESSREIPKKSSEIHVTSDGKTILASDKFGDIYQYPMVPPPEPESGAPGSSTPPKPSNSRGRKVQQTSEDKPRHGELILGHTSVITNFTLTPRDDFVISGDRDEHIRISWFPEGYNIERFCMGHRKYVSALHIPQSSPTTLISGGGDPELFVWDWTSGTLLQRVPVLEKVRPLARVKGGRRAFHRLARRPDGEGLSRKSKRGKGKRKQTQEEGEGEAEDEQEEAQEEAQDVEEDVAADVGGASNREAGQTSSAQAPALPGETKLLHKFDPNAESFVVGRIGSTTIGPDTLVLFTAIGCVRPYEFSIPDADLRLSASGLFYFSLPDPSSSSGMEASPEIQVVDLEYPVLDFCVASNGPSNVWVSVDGTWKTDGQSEAGDSNPKMALLVCWSEGRFIVVSNSDGPPLLSGLNAAIVTANESVVSSLELYAQLAWLPKSREEEADDSGEAQPDEAPIAANSPGPSSPYAEPDTKSPINKPPKKPAGRLRTKEKLQRIQGGPSSTAPKPNIDRATEEPEGEEVQAKKAKVDITQGGLS